MTALRLAPSQVCACGIKAVDCSPGLTYVAQQGAYVKIGTTRDLRTLANRLRALGQMYGVMTRPTDLDWSLPLTLVATFPVNVEHAVHHACREWHVVGEWFIDSPAIRERIETERECCL